MNKVTAVTLALLVSASLSACGTSADSTSGNTGTTQSAEVPAPVIVGLDLLDGATVEIDANRPLVINSDNPTDWSGTVADPAIAEFVPGEITKTAEFNFGFRGLKSGTTDASITDGTRTIAFTIIVK